MEFGVLLPKRGNDGMIYKNHEVMEYGVQDAIIRFFVGRTGVFWGGKERKKRNSFMFALVDVFSNTSNVLHAEGSHHLEVKSPRWLAVIHGCRR